MEFLKSFRNLTFNSTPEKFEELALRAFGFQYEKNSVYRAYVNSLHINPNNIKELSKIPFLPIEFFKNHTIKSGEFETEKIFMSSGTTGQIRSHHHLDSVDNYHDHAKRIFEKSYGPLEKFTILAILPSYLEQGDSSLISMIDYFIQESGDPRSNYYLHEVSTLTRLIDEIKGSGKKVLVIGVTYALLELAEEGIDLHDCIIMETGGMKGRRKEMVRMELHEVLCQGLQVKKIHSEYGMTELTSQAYSKGHGRFSENSVLKILIRDINDPFSYVRVGKSGGINVIDLGNIQSCCFIETKDIGRRNEDGSFDVLGRFDNSDLRGCNLMLV